jgi:hypothetical protein
MNFCHFCQKTGAQFSHTFLIILTCCVNYGAVEAEVGHQIEAL